MDLFNARTLILPPNLSLLAQKMKLLNLGFIFQKLLILCLFKLLNFIYNKRDLNIVYNKITSEKQSQYRDIMNCLQSEVNWKEQTRYVEVRNNVEAERIAEALNFFLGGSEITQVEREVKTLTGTIIQVFWKVGSKGYYHYIGA